MITFETAKLVQDLSGILALQKQNLANQLTQEEINTQGFVTVSHTLDQLAKINGNEKHIVAKDNDKIIGYLLSMTQTSKFDVPALIPMFNVFDDTCFHGKAISDYNYIVIGQACIDKAYRGQGVFDECYQCYGNKYGLAITEIATTNTRSLNAHRRIGFEDIKTYTSPDHIEWAIVIWNWNKQ